MYSSAHPPTLSLSPAPGSVLNLTASPIASATATLSWDRLADIERRANIQWLLFHPIIHQTACLTKKGAYKRIQLSEIEIIPC